MPIGQCKLCLYHGIELQDSHFISKGIYKILRDEAAKNPHPWQITLGHAIQISTQMTDFLLCRECENDRLSRNGENWVLANCLRQGRFRLANMLSSQTPHLRSVGNPTTLYHADKIPQLNRSALAYFAASIFWRGSIHGWNEDGSTPVKLGPFQESFRKYLMQEADFPQYAALVVAVREGKEFDRVTYPPVGERKGLFHAYKFPMPGLAFELIVSKSIPSIYRQMCFVRGPGNPILATSILEKLILHDAARLLHCDPRLTTTADSQVVKRSV
jgi:hypothetical protein